MKKFISMLVLVTVLCGCGEKRTRKVFPVDGFAVAGTATYKKETPSVSIFNTITTTTEYASIPNAVIHVIDTSANDEVVAEGVTDAVGEFIVGLPEDRINSPLAVRILTVSAIKNFPMMVVNQDTNAHAHYVQSEIFIGTKNDMLLEATNGGAFNIFAQIMRGYQFVIEKGDEASTKFEELEVRWESGDVGIDCTCFFTRFFQPDVISLRQDENDDAVILHEFGHYLHYNFSHSTSPGGAHIISCSQNDDPQLTWAEGWATGFSIMVRENEYYIDTDNQNFFVPHERPCHIGQGPTSETLVAAMYLDLYDGNVSGMQSDDSDTISLSFLQIWIAMKRVKASSRLTVYDFYQALLATGAVSAQAWQANFGSFGLDEANMLANSSPQIVIQPSGHVLPGADIEFHTVVEPARN